MGLRDKTRFFGIVAVIMLISLTLVNSYVVVGEENSGKVVKEFYLIDLALVVLTSENTTAWFDTPINYSVKTYEQRAYIVSMGGPTWFNREEGSVGINISNGTLAYIVAKVTVEYTKSIAGVVADILKDPQAFKEYQSEIPDDIKANYIKTPHEAVSTVVKEDFIKWLRSKGYDIDNASKAFIAYKAAQFIYTSGYIRYNASPLPRTLDEVIEKKEGDCDDMSRVLINLLWSLGIPAKMEYGYVYLPWSDVFNIGESYIKFKDAGPHAWVAAYIPPLGWVSLDFLAGARLIYPVIITGSSTEGSLSKREVEEVLEFNIKVRYAEYIAIHPASKLPADAKEAAELLIGEAIRNITTYVNKIAEEYGVESPLASTATATVATVTVTSTTTVTVTKTVEHTVVSTVTSYITKTEEVTTTITKTEFETESKGVGGSNSEHLYATLIALMLGLIALLAFNTYILLRRRRLRQHGISGQ